MARATSLAHPLIPLKLLSYDRLQACLGNNKKGKAKDIMGDKKLTNLGLKTISICFYMVMNQELLVNNSNLLVQSIVIAICLQMKVICPNVRN